MNILNIIGIIKLDSLRNNAHFQFLTEFLDLVTKFGVEELQLTAAWPLFLQRYAELDATLKKIVKSAITDKIKAADAARDAAYSAFVKFLAAMCEHYDPELRDAALNVQVVAHTYGNVAVKPINEETSAIYNLAQELKTDKYKTTVTQIGLTTWLDKLEQANDAFEALIKERDREAAAKNHVAVKKARHAADEIYRRIVDYINALITFGQLTNCAEFVDTLNEIIHRFSITHRRHRHGTHGAETEENEEGTVENETV